MNLCFLFHRSTIRNRPICAQVAELSTNECCADSGSGCECSDDELITKFRERYYDQSIGPASPVDKATGNHLENHVYKEQHHEIASPSSSSTKTGMSSDTPIKDGIVESSDVSSFEDLGAVGGVQSTINPCKSDTDKWQIINNPWNTVDGTPSTSSILTTDDKNELAMNMTSSNTTNLPNSITESPQHTRCPRNSQRNNSQNDIKLDETFRLHSNSQQQQQRSELKAKLEKSLKSRKKITRRQSDGIVYTATTSSADRKTEHHTNYFDEISNEDDADEDNDSSYSDDVSHKRSKKSSCRKCGKTKGDLKRYIARFRHQLETTTNFSEMEIKRQLHAFFEFLENHSRNSFDSKDDETVVQINDSAALSPTAQLIADHIDLEEIEIDDYEDDYDDHGIHVNILKLNYFQFHILILFNIL